MKYMMAACFLMVATTCMAMLQQKPGDGEQPRDGKRPRPNMEQFVKSQATRIAQSLKLDGETSKKFIQTFYNCRKEMAATMKRYPHKKRSEMTDAEEAAWPYAPWPEDLQPPSEEGFVSPNADDDQTDAAAPPKSAYVGEDEAQKAKQAFWDRYLGGGAK